MENFDQNEFESEQSIFTYGIQMKFSFSYLMMELLIGGVTFFLVHFYYQQCKNLEFEKGILEKNIDNYKKESQENKQSSEKYQEESKTYQLQAQRFQQNFCDEQIKITRLQSQLEYQKIQIEKMKQQEFLNYKQTSNKIENLDNILESNQNLQNSINQMKVKMGVLDSGVQHLQHQIILQLEKQSGELLLDNAQQRKCLIQNIKDEIENWVKERDNKNIEIFKDTLNQQFTQIYQQNINNMTIMQQSDTNTVQSDNNFDIHQYKQIIDENFDLQLTKLKQLLIQSQNMQMKQAQQITQQTINDIPQNQNKLNLELIQNSMREITEISHQNNKIFQNSNNAYNQHIAYLQKELDELNQDYQDLQQNHSRDINNQLNVIKNLEKQLEQYKYNFKNNMIHIEDQNSYQNLDNSINSVGSVESKNGYYYINYKDDKQDKENQQFYNKNKKSKMCKKDKFQDNNQNLTSLNDLSNQTNGNINNINNANNNNYQNNNNTNSYQNINQDINKGNVQHNNNNDNNNKKNEQKNIDIQYICNECQHNNLSIQFRLADLNSLYDELYKEKNNMEQQMMTQIQDLQHENEKLNQHIINYQNNISMVEFLLNQLVKSHHIQQEVDQILKLLQSNDQTQNQHFYNEYSSKKRFDTQEDENEQDDYQYSNRKYTFHDEPTITVTQPHDLSIPKEKFQNHLKQELERIQVGSDENNIIFEGAISTPREHRSSSEYNINTDISQQLKIQQDQVINRNNN